MCAYSVFNTFPVYPLSAKPLILLAFCRYRYHTSLFNRPSFKKMSEDIDKGLVTTVIVKDLSRFGRNYIEVGSYSEIIYPEAGVRFIAIMDNVDTGSLESNEFAAFTNLFNEWYPKSTSKKVKEVKKAKGLAGEHLGAPPYGYLRNKKSFIHSDQTVNKQLQVVQDRFKDYQLALYILGFSSFLEVMLLGNFDTEYLTGISDKLENYSLKYRELYTKCYDEIEKYSSTSIQSSMLKGIATTSRSAGKLVEKIPVISKGKADETLIAAGDKLSDFNTDKLKKQMSSLIEHQSNSIRPFIENIDVVNDLCNKPVRLLVDKENIYIATIA